MKIQSYLALGLVLFSSVAMAAIKIEEEVYVVGNINQVKDMALAGSIEIDHVTSKGFEAYGSKGLKAQLEKRGLIVVSKPIGLKSIFDGYPTHAQMTKTLQETVAKYPKIMKLESIGNSVKGKELWVVKISSDPTIDQLKPEVKYISSMHGDEITGRELMVSLIAEIGEKYGKDLEITKLVNNTEIFIMPSMNPDGSQSKVRANANRIDLNRNFPDIISDSQSSPAKREIEVQHVMKFQERHKFSLSANFHGGAVVVNYPWDSKSERHPLDAFVQEISLGYSGLNKPMYNSREFTHGIVNGADWYIVRGGMQDWSYHWFNDLQITVELSDDKYPDYSEIPQFYKDNRDSLIYFLKQVHRGAGITLTKPNLSGSVKVLQTVPEKKDLGSYAFSGSEFYKVLPEGSYTFVVNPTGGETQEINVEVASKALFTRKYKKVKFLAKQ